MRFEKSPGGRRWAAALLGLVGLFAAGCGRTGTVTGKVTFEGKPLGFGRIVFHAPDGGLNGVGTIRDGEYSVSDAPLGTCKVTVESITPPSMPNPNAAWERIGGQGPSGKKKEELDKIKQAFQQQQPEMSQLAAEMQEKFVEIPGNYSDPAQTTLTHEVTRMPSEFSFNMEKPKGWKPPSGMQRSGGGAQPPKP